MNLAIISEVCGYSWAGSEELWLATSLRVLEAGGSVTACLHKDLHSGKPLTKFNSLGGKLCAWQRPRIARFGPILECFRPNFREGKLGDPDVILLSAGSLPSLLQLPGLLRFFSKSEIPYVVLCQFNADCLGISPAQREELKRFLGYAAQLVFVSEHNRRLAERQCGQRFPRALVVMNPIRQVQEAWFPQPREKEKVIFACVARMETLWKGQDLLLDILANPEWLARNWELRFYGEGPDTKHVQEWANELGLSERVSFPGYVREIDDIWKKSHIMVLPSRGEGTPLAVLESMMCGRPVIATDVGGNAEIIEDGVSGFIADAPTPRSFSAAMDRAWKERGRWAEMGRAGHERARALAAGDPPGTLLKVLEQVVSGQS